MTITASRLSPQAPESKGTRIQSVERGCRLLLWLAEQPNGATAKEAAFANRLALPTTYHLLNTLIDQGMLAKDSKRRYTLGQGSALLTQAYLRGFSVPGALLTALRELADRSDETAYLVDWSDRDLRVLASARGKEVVKVSGDAGDPYQAAHARANGKVLLAFTWPHIRAAYLQAHPLERQSPNTICDGECLESELTAIRERGFAFDREEYAVGVSCVAAPIRCDSTIVAALGVAVPTERFEARRDELSARLLDVIATIDGDSR